jgi:hypothetical protein
VTNNLKRKVPMLTRSIQPSLRWTGFFFVTTSRFHHRRLGQLNGYGSGEVCANCLSW